MNWKKEWPIEQGYYWFYGRCFRGDKLAQFHYVEVWKISNGIAYVTRGHFLYKAEGAEGIWQPVAFPELPVIEKGGDHESN